MGVLQDIEQIEALQKRIYDKAQAIIDLLIAKCFGENAEDIIVSRVDQANRIEQTDSICIKFSIASDHDGSGGYKYQECILSADEFDSETSVALAEKIKSRTLEKIRLEEEQKREMMEREERRRVRLQEKQEREMYEKLKIKYGGGG